MKGMLDPVFEEKVIGHAEIRQIFKASGVGNIADSYVPVSYTHLVKALTGKEVKFQKGDILDRDILNKIFKEEKIDSCIHFAGLKAVGESVAKPWEYYNLSLIHIQMCIRDSAQGECNCYGMSFTYKGFKRCM